MNGRIDTADLLKRVDLLDIIEHDTSLERVTRKDEYAGACPWCSGHDRFRVFAGEEPQRYFCQRCERTGDAISYLMRHDGLSFLEAAKLLQELAEGNSIAARTPRQDRSVPPPLAWQHQARVLLRQWQDALWNDEGAKARTWLEQRGLTDAALRYWGIGFNPAPDRSEHGDGWGMQPDKDGNTRAIFIKHGICLPWWDGAGNIWGLRIRTNSSHKGEKYRFVTGSNPFLYGTGVPAWSASPSLEVLVLTEGEFDCMLAWQEAGDLATFATLGSASLGRIPAPVLAQLLRAKYIITTFDADQAGQKGSAQIAEALAGRIVLQAIPPGDKDGNDLTDYHRAGGNLRAWLGGIICDGLTNALDKLALADDEVLARLSRRIGEIDLQAKHPRQPDTPQAA